MLIPFRHGIDAPGARVPRDSSAGAVMAAGAYMIAQQIPAEAERWRNFGDRLLGGLLDTCDLTGDPQALGCSRMARRMSARALPTTCCPMATIISWRR